MDRKKLNLVYIVAGLAGAFVVGFLFGPGIIINPEREVQITPNPVIDGNWDSSDGWEGSDWVFYEWLVTDPDHVNATNYFYIHVTDNYLYILADMVSDVTGSLGEGEWFSVWIDTNNSLDIFDSEADWNATHIEDSCEMFTYWADTDSFNSTLRIWLFDSGLTRHYATTLGASDVTIEPGFQNTINSNTNHRIYEVSIKVTSLGSFNPNAFNVAFQGYGTLGSVINDGLAESWGAPTYFFYEHMAQYTEDIREDCMFRCI